jgi:ketosteroid isomerase-like protein
MQEAQNTKVVQEAYAAFSRGDVQGILDRLDESIVWNPVYGSGKQVPMSGERRGKSAVSEFFKQVAANLNFSRFEPREFVAQNDKVVTLGHYTAKTAIGKDFDSDFAMVFTLRAGKVIHFQEFMNSAALSAAFSAGPTV